MRHPPYHLRPNKAVDRFLLIEIMNRLARRWDFSHYTYYGFGGPFLEDLRLINHYFPDVKLVSIEKNQQTYLRQKFHLPMKGVKLVPLDLDGFLANEFGGGQSVIFWLDYTDLAFSCFADFMQILEKVGDNSILKLTVRAEPPEPQRIASNFDFAATSQVQPLENAALDEFQRQFEQVLPRQVVAEDFRSAPFISLLQSMVQIAAQKALPAGTGRVFQLLNSAFYSDATEMLSITGIVCAPPTAAEVRQAMTGWKHANLTWADAERIDVPILSVKERLALEQHLPCAANSVATLGKVLGYKIDNSQRKSDEKLSQYSDFHRYYPQFAKIVI